MIFFFFNDTATTEIYTLSLHDALPIYALPRRGRRHSAAFAGQAVALHPGKGDRADRGPQADPRRHPDHLRHPSEPRGRSEEHTSELQSRQYLVCRLLLEKKKNTVLTNT